MTGEINAQGTNPGFFIQCGFVRDSIKKGA